MKRHIFYIIFTLLAALLIPVSAFASPFSRAVGDFSLMELVPAKISLGFPVYATRVSLADESGFTKQEVLENPIGRQIRQTTLEIIRDKASGYDKVKAIHEWVHNNISYDDERIRQADPTNVNSSALRTFAERKGICDGYNYLTILMLYFAGIPSVDYGGISRRAPDGSSVAHAWVAALADGKWVYFDPTWGRFDMPFNFHQNVELVRFSDGFFTYEWLVHNNTTGIRIQCVVPDDITEITLPGYHDHTNVHAIDVRANNIKRIIVPASFPRAEVGRFLSAFPNSEEIEVVYDIPATGEYPAPGPAPSPGPTPGPGGTTDIEPPDPEPVIVNPTVSTVFVNGTATAFEAYNIDGFNYFKLRDIAAAINGTNKQFAVSYDIETRAITLTSGSAYTPTGGELAPGDGMAKTAVPTLSQIFLDGSELNFTVYNIEGYNFFRLRDIMGALDIAVTFNEATRDINIDTSRGYLEQ